MVKLSHLIKTNFKLFLLLSLKTVYCQKHKFFHIIVWGYFHAMEIYFYSISFVYIRCNLCVMFCECNLNRHLLGTYIAQWIANSSWELTAASFSARADNRHCTNSVSVAPRSISIWGEPMNLVRCTNHKYSSFNIKTFLFLKNIRRLGRTAHMLT